MGYMKDLLITVYSGGDEAVAAAEKLAGLTRWIPVSERLPELDWDDMSTQVLVATADRMTWIGRYEKDEHGERWYIDTTQPVVAWMPLPEPPEVK